jgi:5-methyltetrahydrofolate--homocysteine methyltransferase
MDAKEYYQALREVDTVRIEELVKKALDAGLAAQQILNDGLIGGMTIIGQEFKCRDLWVPDVLLAARNMHKGIEILKPFFAQGAQGGKGKIVLGTVKGDIHDIGKNLVSIMMSGSGFEVIDLGIDVPLEKFLAAAAEHKPQIIGLSALLTTTMMEMGMVIEAVKTSSLSPRPKVMIGGAPVTEAFAREIGADGYGADAVAAVEGAMKLVGK